MTTAAPALPVSDLNHRLARLTPEQRDLLARRLRSGGSTAARATAAALPELRLDPDRRHEPFPLTDVQEAYWVGRRSGLELGGVSAHGYIEIDARHLDLPRLQQSFNRLVRRHGMLRAVVDADGRQRVLAETPDYVIQTEDLRGVAPALQQARLDEIRARLSHEVLPSDRWPLFSVRASLLNDGVTRVHLSMDVLIFDAWSFDLMSREWEQLYREPQAELPELELSFRDYVLAESAQHAYEPYRRSERYWRERLATLPPAPRLPLAKEPALVREPRFVRRTSTLPADEWRALRERAARHAVTPSVALLTAYADVLGAWCNQPRMTVDLTLFNRLPLHPQVNDIVGDFTSVVLLELDHTRPRPFAERARDAQVRLWEDMDHRYFSGVRVLRELARLRGASPAAQMPVVFTSALHHGQEGRHAAALAWMGATAYTVTQTPQVWLDLQALEDGDRLVLDCDAIEELFPLGLLDDFYGALLGHVRALARDDDSWRRVRPELLPGAHMERVAQLNSTATEVPPGLLHQPFERHADEHPEALAVVGPAGRLTYGEVEALANRLAHALRAAGARPDTLVGVAMRKSWEQVVAVLGVLKAGAAYLPLDPALPAERFDHLLDHGGVELVLTQRAVEQQRRWPASVRRLVVERDAFADLPSTRPEALQRPTDLAYVIFTSGSTGLPKGVMIEHRAALNTVADINRRFALQPHDRALGLSSLSFDLSVYDIFGLLGAGAALVLPDPERLRDPEHWLELIRSEGVSVWNSVPAFLEMLVTCAEGRTDSGIERLRVALLSGDWIPTTLPDRMRALHPTASVVSLGGATEAAIWSIVYPVERVEPTWKSIPYGHALLNQTMHVLDAQLETCPPWVTGDIYIGGLGVARGYWRDEPRTQAAFVTHPRTGERLYRTGDLGRYMADGEIEFLGRGDLQVKVQGYRIELGEIEAALMQCPAVRNAVVQAEGDQPTARRLVAYVVAEDAAGESAKGNGQAAPGIILDPAERLRFKLSQPGLRRDHAQRDRLPFGRRHNGDARESAYLQRRSVRRFDARGVQAEELGALLDALSAAEIDGRAKYRYGSAGALYPVQVYAYVAPGRVAGVETGVYYYHPVQHELVQITPGDVIALEAFDPFNRPMVAQAAFTLFLVADLDAIAPLYGDESREFCLIEAGLISQLLESEAPRHGLGLCQIGGFGFAAVRQHFALGPRHLYLHCVTGGPLPAPGQLATPEGEPAAAAKKPAPSDRGQALRDFLRTKLPEYMVPSSYEFVDALPLSANGKVDRQALSRLEKEPTRKAMEYVAPRSEVERQIAAVWQEVLGVERVGVEDNFFDLGGNSVQMVQIHNRLRRLLQRDFALIDMFVKFPSVRALAEDVVGTGATTPAPAPERAPRHDAHRRRQLEARTAHRRNREHS